MPGPTSKIRWKRLLHSIFTRVILIGLAVVMVGSLTRLYILNSYMRQATLVEARRQQHSFAKHVANDLDEKVRLRQATLQRLGHSLSPSLLKQPEALQAWLAERYALLPLFTAGLSVRAVDGHLLAHYPTTLAVAPKPDGPADPRPRIESSAEGAIIAMAQPVVDTAGTVIATVQGTSRFANPDFLDGLDADRNGLHGGYWLAFPRENLQLQASDAQPVLQELAVGKGMRLLELALTSADDTGEVGAGNGDEHGNAENAIWARTSVPSAGWVVVAYLPSSEALGAVQGTGAYILQSIPLIVLIYLLLAGSGLYYALLPLRRAADHADRMTRSEIPLEPLPIHYQDEVGDLTAAFNRLIKKLDEKGQELREQKEIAETAALAKSRFLAAASHDLRQPMHALNLYLGALEQFEWPPEALPVMGHARVCAQTMDEMFAAMLDISRLDASAMSAEELVFPVADVLNKLQIEFTQQARAKGLQLRTFAGSSLVRSDPELLERMLRNLVANAVRYTAHGKVLVGCRRVGGQLQIGVYDTGPGIAPEHQDLVFEEFYQVGNPARDRSQGLGLGLAIVRRLARLLNTPLRLLSRPGRGSAFLLTVPIARARPARLPAVQAQGRPARENLQGVCVALIDDEKLVLDATRLLLEHWGCSVLSATSGASLVASLAQCVLVPDAIVCDYRLRGTQSGADVIQSLRSEFNLDIPALLVTGDTSPQRIQDLQSTGLQVLHKPVAASALYAALLALLDKD